jgi:outer membrane protein assembly factor BamB
MSLDEMLRDSGAHPWPVLSMLVLGPALALLGGLLFRPVGRRKRVPIGQRVFAGISLLLGLCVCTFGVLVLVQRREVITKLAATFVDLDVESTEKLERLKDVSIDESKLVSTDDWPQWLGPRRNGTSPFKGLRPSWAERPPKVVWKQPIGGGFSSIALAGGRLYTLDKKEKDNHERVVCLDAATGKELWNYAYQVDYGGMGFGNGPRASPAVAGGRVYSVGATGAFLCLDAAPPEGRPVLRWRHDLLKEFDAALLGWGMACSPLVDGDLVYVQPGGKAGTVAAFRCDTGKLAWAALSNPPGYSSPVAMTVAGIRQIVCFTSKGLDGFAARDGNHLWHFDWPTAYDANIATPIVFNQYVFISSGYNAGCALLEIAADGAGKFQAEPVYLKRRRLMRNHHATCVLARGNLYGFDTGANSGQGPDALKCVDLRTGRDQWVTGRIKKGCLIEADGRLIILSQDGTLSLVAAAPEGFVLEGQMQNVLRGSDCWALPALSAGRLYLRDHHHVVCLDLRK